MKNLQSFIWKQIPCLYRIKQIITMFTQAGQVNLDYTHISFVYYKTPICAKVSQVVYYLHISWSKLCPHIFLFSNICVRCFVHLIFHDIPTLIILTREQSKLNPFKIISLQPTRKENNWETEETMERATVTLETERAKWPNPGCLWW
jgi:hypothetical protein